MYSSRSTIVLRAAEAAWLLRPTPAGRAARAAPGRAGLATATARAAATTTARARPRPTRTRRRSPRAGRPRRASSSRSATAPRAARGGRRRAAEGSSDTAASRCSPCARERGGQTRAFFAKERDTSSRETKPKSLLTKPTDVRVKEETSDIAFLRRRAAKALHTYWSRGGARGRRRTRRGSCTRPATSPSPAPPRATSPGCKKQPLLTVDGVPPCPP